jgi:peptidoglycan-associated lipoprotein
MASLHTIKNTRWIQLGMALCTAALVAACSSGVKLDEVPVTDARSSAVTPQPVTPSTGSSTSTVGERAVAAVNVPAADPNAAGPANVPKIIYFDYDSYAIKPEFQSAVDAHARFLNANKSRKIALEGHTDERGGREYNLALGQKRAEAVRQALGLLGVSPNQMEAVSFGEEKPADAQLSEAAFAKNRRAEMNYR